MKRIIYLIICSISFLGINTNQKAQAQNATADFWKCEGKVGGEWNFGRAPYACNVASFQDEGDVNEYWDKIIFKDSATRTTERQRYMSEMQYFIVGMGEAYLKKRKPSVSQAELTAWKKALLALVNQESFWSHYRIASSKVVMMRGDYGHGHGLMQVDDRWHFVQVSDGGAARIQDNIVYALDLMYTQWQSAAKASCVNGETDYTSRTRAMYSAYNGGSTKLCRWTNANDTWAQNDINYWSKFQAAAWSKYTVANVTAEYDFECLVQGGGLQCFEGEVVSHPEDPDDSEEVPGAEDLVLSKAQLYTVGTSYHCTWNDQFLSCLPYSMGDSALQCLRDLFGVEASVVPTILTSTQSAAVTLKMINPNTKCSNQAVVAIGNFVETTVNINLRKTPGGDKIAVVNKGKVFQVLDNYVNSTSGIRYYLISDGTNTGYVHGGTNADYASYLIPSDKKTAIQYVANLADRVRVVNAAGINMRKTAGGTLLLNIPSGERLDVIGRIIQGTDKDVYYQVEYKNQTGYIYSGHLAPSPTSRSWTEVE